MTITEYSPAPDEILDYINQSVAQLREAGVEAKYILLGTAAYETLRQAMAARFRRTEGAFETYQHIPIVLDPFRTDSVAVLPAPAECAKGVQAYVMKNEK